MIRLVEREERKPRITKEIDIPRQIQQTIHSKASKQRNKYKQMQSLVVDQLEQQIHEEENSKNPNFTRMQKKRKSTPRKSKIVQLKEIQELQNIINQQMDLGTNTVINKAQDYMAEIDVNQNMLGNKPQEQSQSFFKHNTDEYKTYEDYLTGITTVFNVQNELGLYKIDRAFSNECMSLVGIHIINSHLQTEYGNKQYLIRCYNEGRKFFEMPLDEAPVFIDVLHTNFAWMMNDNLNKIFAMNVAGNYFNDVTVGKYTNNTPMEKPLEIELNFFNNKTKIEQFKLGYYMQKGIKAVILTQKESYIIPFSLDEENKDKPDHFKKHRQAVPIESFNFQDPHGNDSIRSADESEEELEQLDQLDRKQTVKMEESFIKKFFDFAVDDRFVEYDDSSNDIKEAMLLQDSNKNILIMKGEKYGRKYNLYHTLKLRDKIIKQNNTRYTFEVIDAMLLQTFKVILLIKATQYPAGKNGIITKKEMNQTQPKKILYKMQIWEIIDEDTIKKTSALDISEKHINDVLMNWKKNIAIDTINNDVYIQEYTELTDFESVKRFKLNNNETGSAEPFNMNISHVFDFIGHHQLFEEDLDTPNQGLLYSDMVLNDNLLYISHGKFVSIIDINNVKLKENHALIRNTHKFKEQLEKCPFYDMSNEIKVLLMIDKEFLLIEQRWKVVAVFNNFEIKEIKEFPPDVESENEEIFPQKIKLSVRGEKPKFQFQNYLETTLFESHKENKKIENEILKIYKTNGSQNSSPFFLIRETNLIDNSTHLVLYTIEAGRQTLKKYKIPDIQIDSQIVILNNTQNKFENILIINHNKQDAKQIEYDQTLRYYRLLNTKMERKIEKEKNLIPIKEDIIDNFQKLFIDAIDIYVEGDYIYLNYPKTTYKYNYVIDQFYDEVSYNDNIQQLHIFEEKYFYWRQYTRNEFYTPYQSMIFFEAIDDIQQLKVKSEKHFFSIFGGTFPHLSKIYVDKQNEQIATFINYNEIVIFPFLHVNRIKLRNSGKKTADTQILATQMIGNFIYTLHNDNKLRQWNLRNGKLVQVQNIGVCYRREDNPLSYSIDFHNYKCKFLPKLGGKQQSKVMGTVNMFSAELGEEVNFNRKKSARALSMQNSAEDSAEELNKSTKNLQSSTKNANQQFNQIRKYGIPSGDSSIVGVTQYKIIEIYEHRSDLTTEQDKTSSINNGLGASQKQQEPLSNIRVKEVLRFEGPCSIDQWNNFGMYVSEDLKIFAFYYKDTYKVIQTYYYKSIGTNTMNTNKVQLQHYCKALPNTWLSTHSTDFKYYLKQNKNEQLEISPTDESVNVTSQSKADKLIQINLKLKDLTSVSFESAPSFVAKDKIAFMSSDNIILCYQIFSGTFEQNNYLIPINQKFKKVFSDIIETNEVFNVMQPKFPGSTGQISLDSLFIQGNQLIGENILLLEQRQHPKNPKYNYEVVGPNYFNCFLQQPGCTEKDYDDQGEMKYIQNHFKIKIELQPRMLQGYIFQTKDYIKKEAFSSEVYIVNTFNYYQWRALSLLKKQKILIDDFSKQQLQVLSYCQTPKGKTLLHFLKRNQISIKQLFNNVYDRKSDKEPFFVPILPDINGNTVFHSILKSNKSEKENQNYENFQMIQNSVAMDILEHVADYPFDLFKIRISQIINDFIDIDIVKFASFLERKLRQPSIIPQLQLSKVKNNDVNIFTTQDLWCVNEQNIRNQIETKSADLKLVEVYVLDCSFIHISKNQELNRYNINLLFEKLSKTDNIQIFSFNSIKALIEIKWQYMNYRIFFFLMIPYVLFMICFILYTTYDLEYYDSYVQDQRVVESSVLRVFLWIFVIYFAQSEVRQLVVTGRAYFSNIWNYMDIAILALIVVAEAMISRYAVNDKEITDDFYYNERGKAVRTIYSFCSVIIWIRFLYFFRMFKSTGYYIRMFVEVIKDIRYFIFIFVLNIFAFAHAWYIYLKNSSEGSNLYTVSDSLAYVYNLALGDFDTTIFGDYHPEISWIFYVAATFLLQIVLINLLISIVADTFSRIKSNYNVIMYKDMLHMIIENRFLAIGRLPDYLRCKHLLMAVPVSENNEQQLVASQLNLIEENLREQSIKAVDTQKKLSLLQKIEEKENLIMEKIEKMEERQREFFQSFGLDLNRGPSSYKTVVQ